MRFLFSLRGRSFLQRLCPARKRTPINAFDAASGESNRIESNRSEAKPREVWTRREAANRSRLLDSLLRPVSAISSRFPVNSSPTFLASPSRYSSIRSRVADIHLIPSLRPMHEDARRLQRNVVRKMTRETTREFV